MSGEQINVILNGTNSKIKYNYTSRSSDSSWEYSGKFEGVISNLQRIFNETDSESKREEIRKFMIEKPCGQCSGQRLRKELLSVKIDGKSIMDICNLPVEKSIEFFNNITLNNSDLIISKQILKEINSRLKFLSNVGLNYPNLNRQTQGHFQVANRKESD